MRILISSFILLFLFQSLRAQDTLQHVDNNAHKHKHKTHITDTAKIAHSSHKVHVRDTAKIYKKHPVIMPKYPRDGYVAIMGGLGAPVGSYASAGFASAGDMFSICAAFPGIISRWGIAFKFDNGVNGVNQNEFLESLNNQIGNNNQFYSMITLNKFTYSSFLAGLYLTYPARRFTIDVRILAGVMMAYMPLETTNISDLSTGNNGSYSQSASSGSAFALDFGIEARYPVKPKFCIILGIDYLHAAPSFPIVTTGAILSSYGSSLQENEGGQEVTLDQPFSLFNFSLGVGYTISAKGKAGN